MSKQQHTPDPNDECECGKIAKDHLNYGIGGRLWCNSHGPNFQDAWKVFTPRPVATPQLESNEGWEKAWEEVNHQLERSGGVNPHAYRLGWLDGRKKGTVPATPQEGKHTPDSHEKMTMDNAAKHYVETNPDDEVRRMYGHHYRSFVAGWKANDSETAAELERVKEKLKVYENELGMRYDAVDNEGVEFGKTVVELERVRGELAEAKAWMTSHLSWLKASVDGDKCHHGRANVMRSELDFIKRELETRVAALSGGEPVKEE